MSYEWRQQIAEIVESGQSRSLILSGNITDQFYVELGADSRFVSLTEHLAFEWGELENNKLIILKVDGTIHFVSDADEKLFEKAWEHDQRSGETAREQALNRFLYPYRRQKKEAVSIWSNILREASSSPAVAITFLRELCRLSRESVIGNPLYDHRLIILMENADILFPEAPLHQLGPAYQSRIIQMREWFADPTFANGRDIVILVSESVSSINRRISRLPQVLSCDIPYPSLEARRHYIDWFERVQQHGEPLKLWGTKDDLARMSAALDLHALRQLLLDARHSQLPVQVTDVIARVESHIKKSLGGGDDDSDIVEFKQPTHTLDHVIGISKLRTFLIETVVPRFESTGEDVLSGAIVTGPIGGGKTFIFEAVASMLGMPVLVLKAIRSKWFGETDIILERLHRVLLALSKVMLFIDEADTQFGGVGADTHETERRLTGKLQTWMSDPALKGRVIWLLMTARVHLLSADIRRKGRGGNLIIPVFDPEGEDLNEFIEWMIKKVVAQMPGRKSAPFRKLREATDEWSAADFAHMRGELIGQAKGGKLTLAQIHTRIQDELPGDIAQTRRYQELQALLNCTRVSLTPFKKISLEMRMQWLEEIRDLEAMGIK